MACGARVPIASLHAKGSQQRGWPAAPPCTARPSGSHAELAPRPPSAAPTCAHAAGTRVQRLDFGAQQPHNGPPRPGKPCRQARRWQRSGWQGRCCCNTWCKEGCAPTKLHIPSAPRTCPERPAADRAAAACTSTQDPPAMNTHMRTRAATASPFGSVGSPWKPTASTMPVAICIGNRVSSKGARCGPLGEPRTSSHLQTGVPALKRTSAVTTSGPPVSVIPHLAEQHLHPALQE